METNQKCFKCNYQLVSAGHGEQVWQCSECKDLVTENEDSQP